MKPAKRIWQLQPQTICKVIGMALTIKDLRKIARKHQISANDPLVDEEFLLHSTVVRLCSNENPVSRQAERLVEKRYWYHAQHLPVQDPFETLRKVHKGPEELRIPLWAVLWGLATRSALADAKIETALFGFVHILEHHLVRDYWNREMDRADRVVQEQEMDRELIKLKRDLLDMQQANEKLERIVGNLRIQLERAQRETNGSETAANTEPSHDGNSELREKVRGLKTLLAQAKYCNYDLENENAQLREEIEGLLAESSQPDQEPCRLCRGPTNDPSTEVLEPSQPVRWHCLRGKRITLVGGIESLECHYKHIVESLGAHFSRHNGDCAGGSRDLEDCILSADLVICPVSVNSHYAAKTVKKLCKECGVPCRFPRTASLTGLRKAVEEHYTDEQVA